MRELQVYLPVHSWIDYIEMVEFICAMTQKHWEEVINTIPDYVKDGYVLSTENNEDWCIEIINYLQNYGLDEVTVRA